MSEKNIPAFPIIKEVLIDHDERTGSEIHVTRDYHVGVTVRDYFAAKALQGMLAADGNYGPRFIAKDPNEQVGGGKWIDPAGVARQSYEIADAMLKARG